MYHLVSTDPSNYGTIRFRSSISAMNTMVMYRINSLSTIASFSMTTPEDYMILETTPPPKEEVAEEEEEEFVEEEEGEDETTTTNEQTTGETTNEQTTGEEEQEPELIQLRFQFHDHGTYNLRTLAYELNSLMSGQLVSVDDGLPIELLVTMDSTNRLIISAEKDFTIIDASYRVKLLLGLYDTQLPLSSFGCQLVMPSVPYVSYGNVLYLTARTDFVSVLNSNDKEITRSIAYKVNELLYPGYPINCKLPGQWSIIHSDQLSSLEFQLVDFRLQPIVLHAPLNISLEIERLDTMNQMERTNLMEIL